MGSTNLTAPPPVPIATNPLGFVTLYPVSVRTELFMLSTLFNLFISIFFSAIMSLYTARHLLYLQCYPQQTYSVPVFCLWRLLTGVLEDQRLRSFAISFLYVRSCTNLQSLDKLCTICNLCITTLKYVHLHTRDNCL